MRLIISILFLAVLAGCQSPKIPENFDYGKIEGGIYTNKYFDFEIPVPDRWIVQSKEQVDELKKEGEDLIAEKNKDLALKVKASDISSAILLAVYKNKRDTATNEYNSSFSIVVENLGTMSGINKGGDYLAHLKALMQQSGMAYQFPSGFYSEKLGNRQFDGMDIVMNVNGTDIYQSYYSTIDRNFAISLIISYVGREQKNELKSIVNNIKFR